MEDKRLHKILHEFLDWIKMVFTVFAIVFVVNHVLIANAKVPTGSMEPTIETGSRIILNRLAYIGKSEPKRGDIICFDPPDGAEVPYLKRVIGLPGETIEGRDGRIYIDGDLLIEEYITIMIENDFGPYEIPEGSYFVMGDNRNDSWDSRYWQNKFVNKSAIIGKAEIEYLPKWQVFR